ncbi:acyl carrier protein [Pseudonocardia xinjiangensis]|uniref:Acyl carrier protein n=1 Tax=Pseudonocardia xinjiangensis TaxID=75289 RepID=A0ABX1R714_9PSEU|nr:acyl carrier protein [Pseudonocardia xinjiangensis]NMH76170.1 acyl carrier protein [Pseudonocardia xinjiangensis]
MNQAVNQAAISDKVVATIAAMVEVSPDRLEWDTRLFDDLGLDSTSALELLMRIEDETGIEFDDDTLEQQHFETVGSLVGYALDQLKG